MAELLRSAPVSRSAYLELQQELQLVKNGYEFLDEKRILLAAELLRQRKAYRGAWAGFLRLCRKAAAALVEAAADHGLDALEVLPAPELSAARLDLGERPFVVASMLDARIDVAGVATTALPAGASRTVRDCRELYWQLLAVAAPLAAMSTNLQRLMYEYRRTERRVRALENVILPEIRNDLAAMEEHLELSEQEEVIRVRSLRNQSSA